MPYHYYLVPCQQPWLHDLLCFSPDVAQSVTCILLFQSHSVVQIWHTIRKLTFLRFVEAQVKFVSEYLSVNS